MVQGTSTSDLSVINQQIQDFKDGKTKITKNDLNNILSSNIQQGQEISSTIMDLVDSYDKIDKNSDGISYDEFKTYKNTPSGILSSLGLSKNSLASQQYSLLDAMLGNDSSNNDSNNDLFSLLNTDTNANSSASSLSNLLQNSYSSNNGSNPSLIDYIS